MRTRVATAAASVKEAPIKHARYAMVALCVLALVLMGTGVLGATSLTVKSQSEGANVRLSTADPLNYRPGVVLAKFKPGVSRERQSNARVSAGVDSVMKTIGPRGHEDTQLLRLSPGATVEDAVKNLKARADVEYAEPDYMVKADYTPSDPNFPKQWGLENTGRTIHRSRGIPGADIDATHAWDIEKGQTNPVTVAVADTGIDASHPDLSSVVAPGGYNFAGISCLNWNQGWELGRGPRNQYWAESIKSTGQDLTHIGFIVYKRNNPPYGLIVSVRSGEDINGPDLASYTISASEVPNYPDAVDTYRPLSAAVHLTSGATYYLVIRANGLDVDNYYGIFECDNGYVDGAAYEGNGASWRKHTRLDLFFETNPNSNPRDDCGHGTHVSGIIAAEHNSIGVAGVSAGARIQPVKVMCSDGSGWYDWVIAGIYYAADHGARVINMSFDSDFSSAMQDAVNYAHMKGVLLVAGAGNSGGRWMSYPAGYPNVVGVGATNNRDEIAFFSSYNWSVDLSAPGMYVMSTTPTYKVSLTRYGYRKNYSFMSGTSMACPMAVGLASLVLSKKPSLTPDTVERFMELNADDLGTPGRDDYFGWGRIDAMKTLISQDHFTVNASVSGGNGSVSPETQSVYLGMSATVNAYPDTGYEVASITDNGTAKVASNPYVINNVWEDHTIVVTFKMITYTVNAWVWGGHGTVSPSTQSVNYGDKATINITPDTGYQTEFIIDNDDSMPISNPYQIDNITADHFVMVFFRQI